MSVHYKTEGFVFLAQDRLEADRIFSVFTRDMGRLEVTGRGIRKIASKLRGGIGLFSWSEFEFVQGKHKKTLTDALYIKKFKTLASVPEKLEIAFQISSVVDDFLQGQERDDKLLALLIEVFSRLDENPPRKLIYFYFFWNFVSLLGYAPDLAKVPQDISAIITLIMKKEWEKLAALPVTKETQQLLKKISEEYYHYLRGQTT